MQTEAFMLMASQKTHEKEREADAIEAILLVATQSIRYGRNILLICGETRIWPESELKQPSSRK